ncbi:hypothetical protein EV639_10554 [Rathayibacter tanaceti]|uniref:N-acetyltransferase domain-containing protein n=2 Tax=Rathayibacter tanaceti TaxID=1671680 RepID=A0AAE6V728_9MICO|nr:hypothetical protein [Rathayibacter tanaceti]QHC56134.1 hypothetical protein GSU10_11150 [Rathayibacter tanaceti]TCO36971.1 hypothetical protein EV639_10554 [Rathayibacter tanaceti]
MTRTQDETATADPATMLHPIDPPLPVRLRLRGSIGLRGSAVLRASTVLTGEVIRLSTRAGELRMPAARPGVGTELRLEVESGWLGRVVLPARVTGLGGGDTVAVELLGRPASERSAALLVGTVDAFTFGHLRAAGVAPRRLDRFLVVDEVTDADAFRAALELRLQANQHFGRLTDVEGSEQLVDRWDTASVTLVARLGSKNVGSARVVVNNGDRELSELEHECADTGGLPQRLWDEGFVEASRVGVHPQYRGHGVFCALARAIGRTALEVQARFVVLDSIDKLIPLYEHLGAERLGITKKHQWSEETEQVMAIDIRESLGRIGRNALYWQSVFGPLLADRSLDARAAMRGLSRSGRAVFRAKSAVGRLQQLRAVAPL